MTEGRLQFSQKAHQIRLWAVNAILSHTSMMLYITCKVLVISLLALPGTRI